MEQDNHTLAIHPRPRVSSNTAPRPPRPPPVASDPSRQQRKYPPRLPSSMVENGIPSARSASISRKHDKVARKVVHHEHSATRHPIPERCPSPVDHRAGRRPARPAETSCCEVGDCHRHGLPGTAYCRHHLCSADGCGNVRVVNSRHCPAHKCLSCNAAAAVVGSHSYCAVHKCHAASCARKREAGLAWCGLHACGWPACVAGPVRGAAAYCDKHTCAVGHCVFGVLAIDGRRGKYCCCHTCIVDGCLLGAKTTTKTTTSSASAFCEKHCCPAPGCPNPRLWDDERGAGMRHERCRFHTCGQRGCFAPTASIGAPCDLHIRTSGPADDVSTERGSRDRGRGLRSAARGYSRGNVVELRRRMPGSCPMDQEVGRQDASDHRGLGGEKGSPTG